MDRNELDPSVPSATEVKKIPLIIKVYAVLCILSGVGTLPSVGAFMWQVITALINGNAAAKLGDNTLIAVGLIVAGIMLSAASAVILIIFGLDLIKNQRRNARAPVLHPYRIHRRRAFGRRNAPGYRAVLAAPRHPARHPHRAFGHR